VIFIPRFAGWSDGVSGPFGQNSTGCCTSVLPSLKKPEELAKSELASLRNEDRMTPDLVFRDHYLLDFLGLADTYSERDLLRLHHPGNGTVYH